MLSMCLQEPSLCLKGKTATLFLPTPVFSSPFWVYSKTWYLVQDMYQTAIDYNI
jgi:hypothetical protein